MSAAPNPIERAILADADELAQAVAWFATLCAGDASARIRVVRLADDRPILVTLSYHNADCFYSSPDSSGAGGTDALAGVADVLLTAFRTAHHT